jgi:hypothetical protein
MATLFAGMAGSFLLGLLVAGGAAGYALGRRLAAYS